MPCYLFADVSVLSDIPAGSQHCDQEYISSDICISGDGYVAFRSVLYKTGYWFVR